MGNILSSNCTRLAAKKLSETPFGDFTEVSSCARNAVIDQMSDETFGSAENLLKVEDVVLKHNDNEEENPDGWLVQRHQKMASITVLLCNTSTIAGFDIDTTGFKDCCPVYACIEAYKIDEETVGVWFPLIPDIRLAPNSHNFYQMKHDVNLYSSVRLTVAPGGGIARFRVYGNIVPNFTDTFAEYNLASANLGARIVRWTDMVATNRPNILLDKGTKISQGWLTPRSNKKERNDFVVIQLASAGVINGIVIDTKGFIGNCPSRIQIDGCDSQEVDPYYDTYIRWKPLATIDDINSNALNMFEVSYNGVISHVRVTMVPDGGIQQIKIFGQLEKFDPTPKAIRDVIAPTSTITATITETETTFLEESIELEERPAIEELVAKYVTETIESEDVVSIPLTASSPILQKSAFECSDESLVPPFSATATSTDDESIPTIFDIIHTENTLFKPEGESNKRKLNTIDEVVVDAAEMNDEKRSRMH